MTTSGPAYSENSATASPAVLSWLVWRSIPLVLLLAVEIVAYWTRFDTPLLAKVNVAGAAAFAQYSLSARFAVTAIVGFLIFGGHRLGSLLRSTTWHFEVLPSPWIRFAAHVVASAAFYQLSVAVLDGPHGTWAHQDLWIGIWLATGFFALVCLIAAAIPISLPVALMAAAVTPLIASSLLAAAAVFAGKLTDKLWPYLANGTLWIVEGLLSLFYPDVVHPDPFVVGTTSFSVYIGSKCSGYEGIGLVTVFLVSFLWWYRKKLRFPQSLLLLFFGIAAIWITNAVRIATLIAIGTSISAEVAQNGFHTQAGWLAFNGITLGLIAVAWNSALFSKEAQKSTSRRLPTEYPAAPYLVPLLVMVGTLMLTGAFSSSGFDQLYPLRVLATGGALGYFLSTYQRHKILQWSWSWQAAAIGALVFGIWMILEPLAGTDNIARTEQAAGLASLSYSMTAIWIVFRIIGSIVTVPLAEELAFRGFLTRRLISENFDTVPMGRFTWFSFLLSSLLFGLLHGRWLAGTVAGMFCALALYRRGRLVDAVVAHATANGLITTYVLMTNNWAAWT